MLSGKVYGDVILARNVLNLHKFKIIFTHIIANMQDNNSVHKNAYNMMRFLIIDYPLQLKVRQNQSI